MKLKKKKIDRCEELGCALLNSWIKELTIEILEASL